MAMAARMMSCCTTALLSRAVVGRTHCLASVCQFSAAAASLYGPGVREERIRIPRIHRKICSSASPNVVLESVTENEVQIQLYNTMMRQKEVFRPIVPGKVSMYVCGVTSYDYSHIGHARVYVAFDVLFRYLKSVGYDVTYVRNFTDIDDKIINRANELGEDPVKLSRRFCDEFQVDMELLRCLPPTVEPRVTDHIHQIIEMISKIIENGNAYVMEGGDVYFAVDTLPTYGCLSGRKQDENRAGERVTVDNRKQNPADFALWKSAKPGEPAWDSPWGSGRPGWHIECSAMSAEHLGYKFDIHGGGMDLIFPHHENEIAQSCAACADSRVSYWLHNGFVTVDSEKMSKSLGNFFTIREVLELYHPLALRWFLLGTHYRSPVNYSKRQLDLASDRIFYLYQALADCEQVMSEQDNKVAGVNPSKEATELVTSLKATFKSSMADDLHTPVVVSSFSDPLKLMNNLLHTRKGRKDKSRVASLQLLIAEIQEVLSILGFQVPSYSKVLDEIKELALKRAGLSIDDLAARFRERAAARETKDYARSDQIRQELAALGIALMDGEMAHCGALLQWLKTSSKLPRSGFVRWVGFRHRLFTYYSELGRLPLGYYQTLSSFFSIFNP